MTYATHRSSRNQRARLAAVEPLERRRLLAAIVVNTTADTIDPPGSSVVSLRDAIAAANLSNGATIDFDPTVFATPKTITLSGKALEIKTNKEPVTIYGPVAGVTIDGNNKSADLIVDPNYEVLIYNMTFTGGNNLTGPGGGIDNNGNLVMENVTISNNTADAGGGSAAPTGNGGGIYNADRLNIELCTVSGNTTQGNGAGVDNVGSMLLSYATISGNNANGSQSDQATSTGGGIDNTGTMELINANVSNNGGGAGGGGIDNHTGASMTLYTTEVGDNNAYGGGGIVNQGTASLSQCTVSGNTSGRFTDPGGSTVGSSGGVANYGTMSMTDCTVSGNSSDFTAGGINNGGSLTLADCTVSNNAAYSVEQGASFNPTLSPGDGGGLWVAPVTSAATVIENTVIAGNHADGSGADVFGAVQSKGYNFVGQTNGSAGWIATDLTGTAAHPLDARLSPLGYFGGVTRALLTMIPLNGSPVIDHGSNALIPTGLTSDERGLPRIVNGTVDIGAVESQGPIPALSVAAHYDLTAYNNVPASISPGDFTPGGGGPWLVEVNWGDGTPVTILQGATPGNLPALPHTYANVKTYTGTITVTDATGQTASKTFSVKVTDAPLTGSAAARTGVAANVPFAWQVAKFSDADPTGVASDYSAQINWGDGTSSAGTVASTTLGSNTGPFGVTGTHTYAKAGTYTFVVTIEDFQGASLTVSSTVTCVNADSIVVNTINDQTDPPGSKTVSLRDAVALADQSTVPTAISFDSGVFATAKTITLTGPELDLSSKTSIAIVGPAAGVTIHGKSQANVLAVEKNVTASFSGLTITGGESGLFDNAGVVFLTNCSISGNNAQAGNGGGINDQGGFMVLTDVSVTGNQATFNGGGINVDSGKMTLIDCTVAANSANSGAGISSDDSVLTVYDSTLSGNTASNTGGGVYIDAGELSAGNTIIAGNSAGSSGPDVDGTVSSLGFNLVGKTDGSTGWAITDLTGTVAKPLNPDLGPLANNGGPTQTLLPLSDSPAINHGSNALIPPGLATDQRGMPRIVGGTVDIGAVEV